MKKIILFLLLLPVFVFGQYYKDDSLRSVFGRVDSKTNALIVTTEESNFLNRGQSFFIELQDTLSTGDSLIFVVEVPDTTAEAHFSFWISYTGLTKISTYKDAYSILVLDSTNVTAHNRNGNGTTTTMLTITKSSNADSISGTLLSEHLGGSTEFWGVLGGQKFILKNNSKYIFVITSGANNNYFSGGAMWEEFLAIND